MFCRILFVVLLVILATGAAGSAAGVTPACRSLESSLLEKYLHSEREEGTIHEHVSTLRLYASRVRHVTEAGVQFGTSTWALLQGLHDSSAEGDRRVHLAYDINPFPHADQARQIGDCLGIQYQFNLQDFSLAEIQETDLLFIDTLHVYAQLRNELRAHARHVRQYIIMHDTTVDGDVSECVRMSDRRDCNNLARYLGVRVQEVRVGLWPAIQEFLSLNLEWHLTHRYSHNNGLTILARRPPRSDWIMPSSVGSGPTKMEVQAIKEQLQQDLQARPSSWAHARLGVLLVMFSRQRSLGWDHVQSALAMHPLQLHAQLLLAHSFCPHWARFRCDSSLALERFNQAIQTHNMSEAYLARGSVLVARGDYEQAASSLQTALSMRPGSRHFVDIVGRAFRHMGRTAEASAIFDDAVHSGLWASRVQRPTSLYCPSGVSSVTLTMQNVPSQLEAVRREVLQSWSQLRVEALNASRAPPRAWSCEQDRIGGSCPLGRMLLLHRQADQDVQRAASLPKTCEMLERMRQGVHLQFVGAQLIILEHGGLAPAQPSLEFLSEAQNQFRLLCLVLLPKGSHLSAQVPGGSEQGNMQLSEGDCTWLDASVEHWLFLRGARASSSTVDAALVLSLDVADFSNGMRCEFEPAPLSGAYWYSALRRADM